VNTPAHLVLNLLVVRSPERDRYWLAVLLGAVLPDLPMFFFYAVERGVLGTPEAEIWSRAYFEPGWQAVFDVPNSLVLVSFGLIGARLAGSRVLVAFFLSMGLHAVTDLLLHHDDAHRHFLPISGFRFESPVSYWDPQHFGWLVMPLELLLVTGGCAFLLRRRHATPVRILAGSTLAVTVAYAVFALSTWGPL